MNPRMKFDHLVLIGLLATAAVAHAANDEAVYAETRQSYPKNLARQHLGANLLAFNPKTQKYLPTEAAAAWLDDDVATGWPAMTGNQRYLIILPQPELIHNFSLSMRSGAGTVSVYAGDEPAVPTAKSWTSLIKNVPVESLNQKQSKPFGRFAKYLLVETNLTESGPWYSLYVYGERAAAKYSLQKRAQPVDAKSIFGPYINPHTTFNLSSLYARGKVTYSNAGDSAAWQATIDDNPDTSVFIAPSAAEGGLVVQYDGTYAIQRVSVLSDGAAKGKLDLFLLESDELSARRSDSGLSSTQADSSEYLKANNTSAPMRTAGARTVEVADMTPVATITFDGTNARASADFSPVKGSLLVARWTPETEGQRLAVNEVNSFSDVSPSEYETAAADSVNDEIPVDYSKGGGKEVLAPVGEGKDVLPPLVGEALPLKTPFIPGLPPFPPNIPFSPR